MCAHHTKPGRYGMKQFTVRIDWQSGGLARNREFTTYVARNGLQMYIY